MRSERTARRRVAHDAAATSFALGALVVAGCQAAAPPEARSIRLVQAIHGGEGEAADVFLRESGVSTWPATPAVSGVNLGEALEIDRVAGLDGTPPPGPDTTAKVDRFDLAVLQGGAHPDATLFTAASFAVPVPDVGVTRLFVAHRPNVAGTPPLLHVSDSFAVEVGDAGRVAAFGGCQWLDAPIVLRTNDGRVLASDLDAQGFRLEAAMEGTTASIEWIEAEDEAGQRVRFTSTAPLDGHDLSLVLMDDIVAERCLIVATDWASGRSEVLAPSP